MAIIISHHYWLLLLHELYFIYTYLILFFVKDILGEDGVFLYPTHPTAAPMHYEPIIKPFNFSYTAIINVLGLPATTCPLGLNKHGLPIGIQVRADA